MNQTTCILPPDPEDPMKYLVILGIFVAAFVTPLIIMHSR